MIIKVYPGTDTEHEYSITQKGVSYDLDAKGVTRVDLIACGINDEFVTDTDRTISSDQGDISWSGNVITFITGRLNLDKGTYIGKVKMFSVLNPNGMVVHEFKLLVGC